MNPIDMKTRIGLILIFLIAFGVRLAATVAFEGLHEGPSRRGFGADAVEFNAIAVNLVEHHEYAIDPGHSTSFRAPGFPLLLAAVYAVAGVNHFVTARIVFCLIGAALTLVVFALARRLTDDITALIAALLAALYPNILYYTIHFSSEPLFTLLLTATVLALLCAVEQRRLAYYCTAGLLLGLAALTRPIGLYFAPLFALAAAWSGRRNWRAVMAGLALFGAGLTVVIAPWAVRNYRVHDRWLLLVSNGGSTFWGSNNTIVLNERAEQGGWVTTNRMPEQKQLVRTQGNEVDADRMEWNFGKEFLRAHPESIPQLMWYKLREMWTPIGHTPNKKFNWIIGLSYGTALPFMIVGLWLFACHTGRTAAQLSIMAAPIAGTILSGLVFYGSARFRSTIEPFLLIFAAGALSRPFAKLFSTKSRPTF